MRRIGITLTAIVVVAAACGGNDGSPTTTLAAAVAPAEASVAPPATEAAAPDPSVSPSSAGVDRAGVEDYLVEVANALGEADNRRQSCEEEASATTDFSGQVTPEQEAAYLRTMIVECLIGTFDSATSALADVAPPAAVADLHNAFVAAREAWSAVLTPLADQLVAFADVEATIFHPDVVAAQGDVAAACGALESAAADVGISLSLGCPVDEEQAASEQVQAFIDAEGVTVAPAGAIDSGGGVELVIANADDVAHLPVVVDLFSGDPAQLPVVDGRIDLSESGVVSDGEETNPDRGFFGLTWPQSEGEGSGPAVPEVAPGATLNVALLPGTYVVLDHTAGAYESGAYATLVVVSLQEVQDAYVVPANAAQTCEQLVDVVADLQQAYMDEVALMSAEAFLASSLSMIDDLRFGAALQRMQLLGCDGEETQAAVAAQVCVASAPEGSAAAVILETACAGQ